MFEFGKVVARMTFIVQDGRILGFLLFLFSLSFFLFLGIFIRIIGWWNIDNFLHYQWIILDLVSFPVGVECESFEDVVEHFGIDLGSNIRFLIPFWEKLFEFRAHLQQKLIENVVRWELIQRLLRIVSTIEEIELHVGKLFDRHLWVLVEVVRFELIGMFFDAFEVVFPLGDFESVF